LIGTVRSKIQQREKGRAAPPAARDSEWLTQFANPSGEKEQNAAPFAAPQAAAAVAAPGLTVVLPFQP
jgi:hypothetical protein